MGGGGDNNDFLRPQHLVSITSMCKLGVWSLLSLVDPASTNGQGLCTASDGG